MPIFEYKCADCNTKHEVLHKSTKHEEEVICPKCQSKNNKKLFSAFSASFSGSSDYNSGGCASGNCDIPAPSGCASGMCGLN